MEFAVARAKAQNASLTVAHVLEWSPYTFLTPEEIEERHARRTDELPDEGDEPGREARPLVVGLVGIDQCLEIAKQHGLTEHPGPPCSHPDY